MTGQLGAQFGCQFTVKNWRDELQHEAHSHQEGAVTLHPVGTTVEVTCVAPPIGNHKEGAGHVALNGCVFV